MKLPVSLQKKQITVYGRSNLPFSMTAAGAGTGYLYDAGDGRIYKEVKAAGNNAGGFAALTDAEFYLRDAAGNEVGILDMNKGKWAWYVFGRERFARILPDTSQMGGFFTGDIGNNTDSALQNITAFEKVASELRAHIDKGRPFPEKLMDVELRNTPTAAPVRELLTETHLREMQKAKPSLKTTLLQETLVESEQQMMVFRKANGQERRLSAGEVAHPGDSARLLKWNNGGGVGPGDPDVPIDTVRRPVFFADSLIRNLAYYVHDYLGSTRIVYKPNVSCTGTGKSYMLESVLDYYPYGKILREYRNTPEKYLLQITMLPHREPLRTTLLFVQEETVM